ncbi:MAG TPA: exodeoxyribonuclease VII large subunit [Clostridiaceae bacterium]|nr:exodeoxyribonuclease VII large subunit [Clostridiaceae bacterium]
MTTYSVSELNRLVAKILDDHPLLANIQVNGEISGGKLYPSGHFYFSLKDENSSVNCVMFRSNYNRIKFIPKNGDKVTVKAKASIYEVAGRFQLLVNSMEPQGIGDLYQQFELLKKELANQGYFSENNKKQLPELPNLIGVVTSSEGAVIKDIINVLRRRFPGFKMHFVPVAVQGFGAAEQIADAIELLNFRNQVDVIIIARGGGSIEDLWAFNEKVVADAIFNSQIPIISAVGHETDYTIADFCADLRAPTPSAAAELVVPEKRMLLENIQFEREKLIKSLQRQLFNAKQTLDYLMERSVFKNPRSLIDQQKKLIVELSGRLEREIKHQTNYHKRQITFLYNNLQALNPFSILERGYAYIESSEKTTIDSVNKISSGQKINIHWSDGKASAEINEITYKRKI